MITGPSIIIIRHNYRKTNHSPANDLGGLTCTPPSCSSECVLTSSTPSDDHRRWLQAASLLLLLKSTWCDLMRPGKCGWPRSGGLASPIIHRGPKFVFSDRCYSALITSATRATFRNEIHCNGTRRMFVNCEWEATRLFIVVPTYTHIQMVCYTRRHPSPETDNDFHDELQPLSDLVRLHLA